MNPINLAPFYKIAAKARRSKKHNEVIKHVCRSKTMNIFINSRKIDCPLATLSYEQIVALANKKVGEVQSVNFLNANGEKKGTVERGQTVTVKERTEFSVN